MSNLLRAFLLAGSCCAQAFAGSAPMRLGNPGLPLSQPQIGALGSMLAAPGAPLLKATLSLTPSLTPAIPVLQPVPQLKLTPVFTAPAAPEAPPSALSAVGKRQRSEDGGPLPAAMPALETLADRVQVSQTGSPAAVIGSFYDRSGIQAAPADVDRSAPLAKDPATNLYGVSPEQLKTIVAILRRHYGDNLLDLAAIGSRAKGKASALKNFRPPTGYSDLDLAPLLRDMGGRNPDSFAMEREIEAATGIPIQLHGVLSGGEEKYKDAVPFYGGGYETYEWFSSGDAVRLALDI